MGSCFSKKKQIPSSTFPPPPPSDRHFCRGINPPATASVPPVPPPPHPEEETVKEVIPVSEALRKPEIPEAASHAMEIAPISEASKPDGLFTVVEPKSTPDLLLYVREEQPLEVVDDGGKGKEEKTLFSRKDDEFSEFSEICSASESISAATVGEKGGGGAENGCEEVEMRPKENWSPANLRRKRSFAGDSSGKVERRAKSPARRSDTSPSRNAPTRATDRANRSRIPNEGVGSRGDAAQRRSRSPATRKELGRSPSGKRSGMSPRRKPAEPVPRKADAALASAEGPAAAAAAAEASSAASKESLENPHVAMECFIFL